MRYFSKACNLCLTRSIFGESVQIGPPVRQRWNKWSDQGMMKLGWWQTLVGRQIALSIQVLELRFSTGNCSHEILERAPRMFPASPAKKPKEQLGHWPTWGIIGIQGNVNEHIIIVCWVRRFVWDDTTGALRLSTIWRIVFQRFVCVSSDSQQPFVHVSHRASCSICCKQV